MGSNWHLKQWLVSGEWLFSMLLILAVGLGLFVPTFLTDGIDADDVQFNAFLLFLDALGQNYNVVQHPH